MRRVDLLDLALVHHDDPVGSDHRLGLVVGHVDGRDLELVVQAADLEAHLLAQVGVEIGERLVEQQDFRFDDDGAGQRHTLLLAARQFGGIAPLEVAHLDHVQDLVDAAVDLGARQLPDLQTEADILAHRHVRPDGVALEDHRHAAILGRHDARGGRNLLAVHLDAAVGRRHEARDHAQGRGLAAARRAQQRDELALGELQREIGTPPRTRRSAWRRSSERACSCRVTPQHEVAAQGLLADPEKRQGQHLQDQRQRSEAFEVPLLAHVEDHDGRHLRVGTIEEDRRRQLARRRDEDQKPCAHHIALEQRRHDAT